MMAFTWRYYDEIARRFYFGKFMGKPQWLVHVAGAFSAPVSS